MLKGHNYEIYKNCKYLGFFSIINESETAKHYSFFAASIFCEKKLSNIDDEFFTFKALLQI